VAPRSVRLLPHRRVAGGPASLLVRHPLPLCLSGSGRRWEEPRRCGGGGVAGVGNGGPAAGDGVVVAWRRRAPTCLAFFFFFLCREYLWVAHGKERETPSRRGRPSTPFFAVRHKLRTTKNCVVR
jgi:hypothetical protein